MTFKCIYCNKFALVSVHWHQSALSILKVNFVCEKKWKVCQLLLSLLSDSPFIQAHFLCLASFVPYQLVCPSMRLLSRLSSYFSFQAALSCLLAFSLSCTVIVLNIWHMLRVWGYERQWFIKSSLQEDAFWEFHNVQPTSLSRQGS